MQSNKIRACDLTLGEYFSASLTRELRLFSCTPRSIDISTVEGIHYIVALCNPQRNLTSAARETLVELRGQSLKYKFKVFLCDYLNVIPKPPTHLHLLFTSSIHFPRTPAPSLSS